MIKPTKLPTLLSVCALLLCTVYANGQSMTPMETTDMGCKQTTDSKSKPLRYTMVTPLQLPPILVNEHSANGSQCGSSPQADTRLCQGDTSNSYSRTNATFDITGAANSMVQVNLVNQSATYQGINIAVLGKRTIRLNHQGKARYSVAANVKLVNQAWLKQTQIVVNYDLDFCYL